jgi:hypothetical protein
MILAFDALEVGIERVDSNQELAWGCVLCSSVLRHSIQSNHKCSLVNAENNLHR